MPNNVGLPKFFSNFASTKGITAYHRGNEGNGTPKTQKTLGVIHTTRVDGVEKLTGVSNHGCLDDYATKIDDNWGECA